MALPEDRLIAISYIKAKLAKDLELVKLIEETTDNLILARETAEISLILATTLGLSLNRQNPPSILKILEDLREIYYE
jgi:hypothetical protein